MGDIELAIRQSVPRSTDRGWLTTASTEVVTLDILERNTLLLQQEVIVLQSRIARLVFLLRLVVIVT